MMKTAADVRDSGLRIFDLAVLGLAFPIAYAIYAHLSIRASGELLPLDTFWPVAVLVLVSWPACASIYQVYEAPLGRSRLIELARAARALATVAVVIATLAFLTRDHTMPRLFFGLYFSLVLVLLVAGRTTWRAVATAAGRGRGARRYAVVGTGGMAREIVESISAHPEWGLHFAGFVRLDSTPVRSRGEVLGNLDDLGRVLEEDVLDVVVFAVPRGKLGAIERGIQLCEEQGVEVRISLDLLRYGEGRMTVADLDGVPMLALSRIPSDVVALAAKRAFDIASSALALAVLSPVLIGIAIAISLESPGPVFFRQLRVGLNGRAFTMLKFRSMYRDAEARLEALRAHNEMSGPVFKMANDPRVTRVGRFLRRTSLDELPQFLNVLAGDMSIVGPRPPIPAEVRLYKRWQRRRLSVRPGITCIWQISGRNNIDFDRWMELDLQYIDRWSLWGDIAICLKTIPAVLSARGAR
jgi:exopolysaccharide biosynthesis polyprenyl glycosylphosphotransferase